jgi:hypothetical protein
MLKLALKMERKQFRLDTQAQLAAFTEAYVAKLTANTQSEYHVTLSVLAS